jgi:hypothetical protein
MPWAILFLLGLFVVGLAYLYMFGMALEPDDCSVIERIPTEDGWIEIVDEACKEGLPHTTDANTIRMTREKYDGKGITSLLVHERVHLDQKRRPEAWQEFYKQVWDYEIRQDSPIPEKYTKHLRPNPDTAAAPWAIWRQRYVFFPYTETGELKSAPVRIWDMLENTFVAVPEQWKARFCDADGCPYQYEHPHEISAELLTKPNKSVGAAQLLRWYK